MAPGFPEVAGESCTTEDVRGQEITFRNLVPDPVRLCAVLYPLCMGVMRRVKKTEVPPCLRQVVNYGGFIKNI